MRLELLDAERKKNTLVDKTIDPSIVIDYFNHQ